MTNISNQWERRCSILHPPGLPPADFSSSSPGEVEGGGRASFPNRGNWAHISRIPWANLTKGWFSCWRRFTVNSSRAFMFPCASNVANLCIHTPSKHLRASSASSLPSWMQSIICMTMLFNPCWAKCFPKFVDSSLTSLPWLPCLTCMNCVVLPVYCFPHWLHVTK